MAKYGVFIAALLLVALYRIFFRNVSKGNHARKEKYHEPGLSSENRKSNRNKSNASGLNTAETTALRARLSKINCDAVSSGVAKYRKKHLDSDDSENDSDAGDRFMDNPRYIADSSGDVRKLMDRYEVECKLFVVVNSFYKFRSTAL